MNNSWCPSDDGATLERPGPLAASAIEEAILTGRTGKGRLFVWGSGNGSFLDNCYLRGASVGQLKWLVSGPPTSDARIRVIWTADPDVRERTDAAIQIR